MIDASYRLIHPGLINAHTHGHGNLSKGMGDRWTLELLLTAGPWISGNRTVEDKYLTTYIGALEMLMKGCTACYDLTVEFPQPTPEGLSACAKAYADAGMRAVVAPMVASLTFYDAIPGLLDVLPAALQKDVARLRMSPYEASLAAMRQVLKDWRFDREQLRPAVAPTIPHHCSDAFMRACAELAREFGVGLHSHIQESKAQVIVGLKTYGKTQTAHLQDLGLLGPDFVAAHGVWLDNDDIRRLADHGASVAHNPGSNMLLGNGIAAVKAMLQRQLNVGIGTDGAACCDNQNMYEVDARRLLWLEGPRTRHRALAGHRGDPDGCNRRQRPSARSRGSVGQDRQGLQGRSRLHRPHPRQLASSERSDQSTRPHRRWDWGAFRHGGWQDGGGKSTTSRRRFLSLARRAEAARERLVKANAGSKHLFQQLEGLVNAFCPGLAKTPYHIDRFAGGRHVHYARQTAGSA